MAANVHDDAIGAALLDKVLRHNSPSGRHGWTSRSRTPSRSGRGILIETEPGLFVLALRNPSQ
jgi:hypothetical protein